MNELRTDFNGRREELGEHFILATALQDRVVLDSTLGEVSLSVRHINTIKSGLIIHLYNIEEATMTKALSLLGAALGSSDPRKWTDNSLKEWLRETIVSRTTEGGEDGRLTTVFRTSNLLLTETILGPQKLKKPAGTWDDKVIAKFLERAGISCPIPAEMWQRIAATPEYGDNTPLQFLAKRRNAIAHGRRSFEDGASDMQLSNIQKLADTTLDYLSHIIDAFQEHLENEKYLISTT